MHTIIVNIHSPSSDSAPSSRETQKFDSSLLVFRKLGSGELGTVLLKKANAPEPVMAEVGGTPEWLGLSHFEERQRDLRELQEESNILFSV